MFKLYALGALRARASCTVVGGGACVKHLGLKVYKYEEVGIHMLKAAKSSKKTLFEQCHLRRLFVKESSLSSTTCAGSLRIAKEVGSNSAKQDSQTFSGVEDAM